MVDRLSYENLLKNSSYGYFQDVLYGHQAHLHDLPMVLGRKKQEINLKSVLTNKLTHQNDYFSIKDGDNS